MAVFRVKRRVPAEPMGAAARVHRMAADPGIPVQTVADTVVAVARELYLVVADHDASVLHGRLDALVASDAVGAQALDERISALELGLEQLLGPHTPSVPGPDGSGRATARARRRLCGLFRAADRRAAEGGEW